MLGLNPLASAPLGDLGVKNVSLSGSDVTTNAPTVGEGTLSQLGVFAGQSVITQNPVIDTSAISQNHSLDATYNGNGASVPNGTMFEDESFSAPNVITGTVRVATGVLTENHDLQSPDVTAQNVSIASTAITENNDLELSDITTGSPTLSSTAATETFAVTVVGGNPSDHPYYNVGSTNKFAIDGSTATADVAVTLIEGRTYRFDQSDSSNNGHPLRFSTTANGTHASGLEYTTGVTVVGTAGNSGAYTEIAVAIGAPQLYYYCSNHSNMGWSADTDANTTIAISQDHAVASADIATGNVSIASTAITQIHDISTDNAETGNVSLPNAVLTQIHDLGSQDVEAQAVSIDSTNLDENHELSASDITFGTPTVASTNITQIHTLDNHDAISTGAVSIATTAITQIHNITSDNAETSNVDVETSAITQVHDLTSDSVTSGAIDISQGVFTQNHPFATSDITLGNVEIDTTTCIFSFDFAASDINYGTPTVGQTSISQIHNIEAVYNGRPADVPTLTMFEDETFSAPDVFTGTVRVSPAVFIQDHLFASADITTEAPSVDNVVITGNHVLTSDDVTSGAVTVDDTNAVIQIEFLSDDVTSQAPSIDQTGITQIHNLEPTISIGGVAVQTTAITQLHFLAGNDVISANVEVQETKNPWDGATDLDDENYTQIPEPSDVWSTATAASTPTFTTQTPNQLGDFLIHTEPATTIDNTFQLKTHDITRFKNKKVVFYFGHTLRTSGFGGYFWRGDLQLDNMTIGDNYYSFQDASGWSTSNYSVNPKESDFNNITSWTSVSSSYVTGRWLQTSGGTPSQYTGITLSNNAYYFYTESTSTDWGHTFWLRSPTIDLGDNTEFKYYLGRYGYAIGEFNVWVKVLDVPFTEQTDNSSTWTDAA